MQIGLWQDLAELTPRLGIRIEKMLELGARTEMERAFARCEQRTAPAFDSIGCRELLAWILEECSEKECRELWLKNTRAYAKRQITWFKKVAGRRLRTAYGEGGPARCRASFFHAFSPGCALPCEGRGILITMEVCVMNKFVCVMLVAAAHNL